MCIILPLEIRENLVFWEEACEIPCYSFHMHSQFCSVPVGSMYVNGGESCFYFHSFFFSLLLLIITGSFLVLYIEDSFWVALYVKRDRLCFGWHRNQLLFISNTQVIYFLLLAMFLELCPFLQGKKSTLFLELKLNMLALFFLNWKTLTVATMSKACSGVHPLSQIHG